jgi:serine/threonine-protein kinase
MTTDDRPRRFGPGDVLDGRYQLVRELGRGAAGAVYEARHLFTGRMVAAKVLLPHPLPVSDRELRERLQREGRALASIRHPGVVDVLDGGVTMDGWPFIIMEMLSGRTLEGFVAARGTLTPSDTVGVALQLCSALDAVHRAGIVHRDVKPTNVIVVRDDDGTERVKLVDFGIARLTQDERITGLGVILGTPAYMSPEQLLAFDTLDGSTDVYSVGVTMFECLTGKVPYLGPYPQILIQASSTAPTPSVRGAGSDVPSRLADVVDRAIAKNRADRFQTPGDLASALLSLPGASPRTMLFGAPLAAAGAAAAQRRQWRRAPYNTPVHIVLASGGLDGRSEDVSEGGMLVVSRDTCAAGQHVGLRFALPMEGKVVTVDAHVRWVRATGATHAVGLEFESPPAHVRASIAQYVGLMSERADA